MVIKLYELFVFLDPVRIAPDKMILEEGQNHVIECLSNKPAKWFFEHGELPQNAIPEGHKLIITGVNIENYGIYECIGYYRNGDKFLARSTLLVMGKHIQKTSCFIEIAVEHGIAVYIYQFSKK